MTTADGQAVLRRTGGPPNTDPLGERCAVPGVVARVLAGGYGGAEGGYLQAGAPLERHDGLMPGTHGAKAPAKASVQCRMRLMLNKTSSDGVPRP